MSKGLTQLPPDFIFRLETPSHIAVKVFTSLCCKTWGYLRIDNDLTYCIDPWTTAMKYLDHMATRGWEVNRVDNFRRDNCILIVVTVERPLV